MGKCRWTVHLQDGVHTVDLEHGYWSGKRRIFVDGQLTHVGGGFFLKVWAVGSRDVVSVGGHACEFWVKPNFRTNNYDYALIIDGELFEPGETRPSRPPLDARSQRSREYQEELDQREAREEALKMIVRKAISDTLQHIGESVPRVFRHLFYGAVGIHPRYLTVWYVFQTDAEMNEGQSTGLTDQLDRITRGFLRDHGYPEEVLDQTYVSFCSQEDIQRTAGGDDWLYFK